MKRFVALLIALALIAPGIASASEFSRGYQQRLGHIAADATVAVGTRALNGIFRHADYRQPCYQQAYPAPYAYASMSAYDQAYALEMVRLQRQEAERLRRLEIQQAIMDARRDSGYYPPEK